MLHSLTEFLTHSTEWLLIVVTVLLVHATYKAAREEHRHSEKIQEETTEIVSTVLSELMHHDSPDNSADADSASA